VPEPPPSDLETIVDDTADSGFFASGEEIQTAAVEAEPPRRRRGLGIGAWLAIGWLLLVVGGGTLGELGALPIADPTDVIHLHTPCPRVQGRTSCLINRLGPFAERGTAHGHLLGGDSIGRDMLSRLVYGGFNSMLVATLAIGLGFVVGGALGLLAGYFGGRVDSLLSGVFNVLLSIPAILLALSLAAFLKGQQSVTGGKVQSGFFQDPKVIVILAIGVVSIPLLARITRASALSWSQREFVLAARAQGAKPLRIMWKEVLPNVLPAMLSIALLGVAVAVVAEGSLAILGAGLDPTTASWGNIIAQGRGDLESAPHIVFEPSIMIFLTVLALNFLGDVIRARGDVREAGI